MLIFWTDAGNKYTVYIRRSTALVITFDWEGSAMGKRVWMFVVFFVILTAVTGCTDLDAVDLTCRIPLAEYSDVVGSWKDLVSFSDSRRSDNWVDSFITMIRLKDFVTSKDASASFTAGGSTYSLRYQAGEVPMLLDQYGNPVALTEAKSTRDGDWNQGIRCSLAEVGNGVSFDEYHTLAFTMPENGRTCSIWAHSWFKTDIRKAQGTRKDFFGNTVYYDYPYAEVRWGLETKVGVRYYLKGQYILTGEKVPVKLTALITDTNMDGVITEQDTLYIDPQAKGGTKGGLRNASYPMNQIIPISDRYGYKLNLVNEAGPEGTRYFLDVKRQETL